MQIEDVISLIRTKRIPRLKLKCLSSLIIQRVSFRDCIANLLEKEIQTTESFDWVKFIRFYYNEEDIQIKQVIGFPLAIILIAALCYLNSRG